MRVFFTLTLLCLLFSGHLLRASAQATPPPPAPRASTVDADTAMAVQRLFSKHRTGGIIWAAIGAAFAGRILGASIGDGFNNAGGTVVGVAVLGGVPGGIGISKLVRFSKAREEVVLASFRQTRRLPPYVRKRLKATYF